MNKGAKPRNTSRIVAFAGVVLSAWSPSVSTSSAMAQTDTSARGLPQVRLLRTANGMPAGGVAAGMSIERIDVADGAPLPTIYSVQSRRRGLTPEPASTGTTPATTGVASSSLFDAEAVVYESILGGLEFGVFRNFGPTTGAVFPGTMLADNVGLGGGFETGGSLSGYELRLFRSSADPNPGVLADIHVELWDGDPFCLLDTPGGGFACAPIPGTAADFVDIPHGTRANFRTIFPAPVTLPVSNTAKRVWMVVSTSETANAAPCRLGWIISGLKPRIGNDLPLNAFGSQSDWDGQFDGAGTCCTDGAACQVETNPCPGDENPGVPRGFCSDGDAESAGFFDFGSNCTGIDDTDFCSNFVASVFAPAQTTMAWVPIGNTHDGLLDPGASITGREITLISGDTTVYLEIRIGSWDPRDLGTTLKAYQGVLDSTGYTSGLQGTLSPKLIPCHGFCIGGHADGGVCTSDIDCATCESGNVNADLACASDRDCDNVPGACSGDCDATGATGDEACRAASGGSCGGLTFTPGAPCVTNDDCPDIFLNSGLCKGAKCAFPTGSKAFCDPGFINVGRTDYLFLASPSGSIAVIDVCCFYYRFAGAVTDPAQPMAAPSPFPEGGLYGGTLVLDVPADALGTFTVGFIRVPNSVLVSGDGPFIPLFGLASATINIIGEDCNDNRVHDFQDVLDGTSADLNDNSIPDECECPPPTPQPQSPVIMKSRYLSFVPGDAFGLVAFQITFVDMPAPFEVLNGTTMWAGPPREVSHGSSLTDDTPPTFTLSRLRCEPFFTDWNNVELLNVYHRNIVPGAVYEVTAVFEDCGGLGETNVSPALTLRSSRWGDAVGIFMNGRWQPPDGTVDITDVVVVLERFVNLPGAIAKPRVDFQPETPNQDISILDVVFVLEAFKNFGYPFTIDPNPCGP